MIWVPGHWSNHRRVWVHGHYIRGEHRRHDFERRYDERRDDRNEFRDDYRR
jgi:hypothetical protein